MPHFREGVVTKIVEERPQLQRVEVDGEPTFVLLELTGSVQVGDRVIINTTAVDLDLGTGGWHLVHWNLERRGPSEYQSKGEVMKLRYTSLQTNPGVVEEELPDDLGGTPVVALALHSQLGAAAAAVKMHTESLTVVYVMTEAAALPLAISDLVWALRSHRIVDSTVTAGNAFGGSAEAINVRSAYAIAKHRFNADVILVGMGPGSVGSGTAIGFSGLEVGSLLDAAYDAHGTPVAALRVSYADMRERHRGVSHHSLTALRTATHVPFRVPIPADADAPPDLGPNATVERVEVPDAIGFLKERGIEPTTMGRSAADDPHPFAYAAAAGAYAARLAGR